MKKILFVLIVLVYLTSCKKEDTCRTCDIVVNESFSIRLNDGFDSPVEWGYSKLNEYSNQDICTDEHWEKLMEHKDKFEISCD